MAGTGTPKGERRNPNGRPKGIKNKVTLERERLAEEAMRSASKRKAMGDKLAREVLAWGMMRLFSIAEDAWKVGDEPRALDYTERACNYADKLAPYESPRLQSIAVHRADPFDQMTDEQLYEEFRKRAAVIGLSVPGKMPVLLNGTVNRDG